MFTYPVRDDAPFGSDRYHPFVFKLTASASPGWVNASPAVTPCYNDETLEDSFMASQLLNGDVGLLCRR